MTFELDRAGGAEVLKEMAAAAISELALQIGEAADEGAKVAEFSQITERVGDRFRASVTVPAERQAKYGVLTKAAAAAGLEVRPRAPRRRKKKSGTSDDA